jgi:hypothetical protein
VARVDDPGPELWLSRLWGAAGRPGTGVTPFVASVGPELWQLRLWSAAR